MKKYVAVIALLALPALAMAQGNTLSLLVGGQGSVTAQPGDTLTVDVVVNLDTLLAGYDAWATASTSGIFDITSETRYAPWNWFTSGSAVGGLDTTSPTSTGLAAMGQEVASGTILTWDVVVDSAAPNGTYTITPGANLSDPNFGAIAYTAVPLTVVIPEPATMLLLAGALPFLRRRRA